MRYITAVVCTGMLICSCLAPTVFAVRVTDPVWVPVDEYQRSMVNSKMARAAQWDATITLLKTTAGAGDRQQSVVLVSFARRVDAAAAVEEAHRYGIAVRALHLSVGETQHAFPFVDDETVANQLLAIREYLLNDIQQRASELKSAGSSAGRAGDFRGKQQSHWENEELSAINAFLGTYASRPLVANGFDLQGSPEALIAFANESSMPMLAIEISSTGIQRLAIPLDIYRGVVDGQTNGVVHPSQDPVLVQPPRNYPPPILPYGAPVPNIPPPRN